MPHRLKMNAVGFDCKLNMETSQLVQFEPECEGDWEQLLLQHSLNLNYHKSIYSPPYQKPRCPTPRKFPEFLKNGNDLPVRVDTALEDEASTGYVYFVPDCAHALTHPGKHW